MVAFIISQGSPCTDFWSGTVIAKRFGLTISFKMLISLKSMRFSSSSMWLFLSTLTARCALDSLCTHMRTSPNAPEHVRNDEHTALCRQNIWWHLKREETYLYRGFFQFCNNLWAFPVSCRRNRKPLPMLKSQKFSWQRNNLLVSTIVPLLLRCKFKYYSLRSKSIYFDSHLKIPIHALNTLFAYII